MTLEKTSNLFAEIKAAVLKARNLAYRNSNGILLNMYWEIGRIIVEDEQKGTEKAAYGKAVLKNLAEQLTFEFGKGFDESNLRNIRQFYLAFQKRDALRHELSWTHYRIISRVANEQLRLQYIHHAIEGNWDTRTLQRNVKTNYVGRILELTETEKPEPSNLIKDPYIFEVFRFINRHEINGKQSRNRAYQSFTKISDGTRQRFRFRRSSTAYRNRYF